MRSPSTERSRKEFPRRKSLSVIPPIHPYTPRPFSPLHPHPVWKTGAKPSAKREKTAILAKFARPQGKLSTGCGFVDKPKSAETVRRSSPQNPFLLAKKYAAYASRAGRNPPQEARIYKRMGFSPQGCGCQGVFFHNLSQTANAGGSTVCATFPQFPQGLLLLLFNIISTATILVLGCAAYGRETLAKADFRYETEVPICSLP